MAKLSLNNLCKTYDDGTAVIKGIDLTINDGEFMVFVGPSGCGKSTLLRMIAGLEEITSGELYIGDRRCNEVPPSQRGIAMVFQSYALYPHMTVAENMGFALKLAGHSKAEIRDAVGRAAEILRISPLLDRKPKALSGGQRQRVAIGRAIVRKPQVFLFDEPLSNLDAALRVEMRAELAHLHRELKTTMVYVTHDQVEAMTLSQRIAVFHGGHLEQVGPAMELYDRPANLFVAGFLGSPKINTLPVQVVAAGNGRVELQATAGTAALDVACAADCIKVGDQATLGFRPDHVQLLAAGGAGIAGRVDLVERLGDATLVYVRSDGASAPFVARLPGHAAVPQMGDRVTLQPDASRVSLFDAAGRALPAGEVRA